MAVWIMQLVGESINKTKTRMANYEEMPKASLVERPIKRHEEKKLDDELVREEKEDGSLENSISTGDLGDAIAYQHPIAHHHQPPINHSSPPTFIFTTTRLAAKPRTCATEPVSNPPGSSTNSDDLQKKTTGFISLWEEGIPSLNSSISPQTSNSEGQELQRQQIRDDPVSNSLGSNTDNGGMQRQPVGFISLWEEGMSSLNITPPPRTSNVGGQKLCDGESDCTGDSGGDHLNSFLPPSRLSRDVPIKKIEKDCQESIRMYAQLEKNWKLVKACSFV